MKRSFALYWLSFFLLFLAFGSLHSGITPAISRANLPLPLSLDRRPRSVPPLYCGHHPQTTGDMR
jgi:hypothetical protein